MLNGVVQKSPAFSGKNVELKAGEFTCWSKLRHYFAV